MLKVKKMSKSIIAFSSVVLLVVGSIQGAVLAKEHTPTDYEERNEEDNKIATLVPTTENKTEEQTGGFSEIISVKMSDKDKFTEKNWKEVLKGIEAGEIILEDE